MRKSWFVTLTLLVLVTLLTAVASAQVAPRTVPSNDNFANAKPITIGKNYTVLDIGAATVEPGQPGVTSCGPYAAGINHSVWFSIYVSDYVVFHLSTEGTNLTIPMYDSTDTVMAIFSGDSLGSLVQIACNDDSGTTLLSTLSAGAMPDTNYYIMVGTYSSNALDPTSVLKLNTRLLYATINPNNASFEQTLTSADWKVVNSTGDARICADPAYPAYSGACAFRFMGNAGESSKLKQTFLFPGAYVPRKNGLFIFVMTCRVMDAPLGPVKITSKVTYADGTPASKRSMSLTGMAPWAVYNAPVQNIYLASSKIASLSIEVSFKSTSGALMIDAPYVLYYATASTRDAVLPAPLAAQTKR